LKGRTAVKQGTAGVLACVIKVALQIYDPICHPEANSSEQLRSYHYFLAKTYFALGRREDAQAQMNWVESHPQN
jgi:hypothetical protein